MININGYQIYDQGSSGLAFGSSGTRILPSNYGIKDPALPGMLGEANAGGAYKGYPFTVNAVYFNNGSPWNTSTYLFTCPVAGIYYISYSGIVGEGITTSDYGYFAVIINGANWYWSFKQTAATWELHHSEILIKLQAGDNIRWAMNTAPGPDGGTAGAYRSQHNACTIWLVG